MRKKFFLNKTRVALAVLLAAVGLHAQGQSLEEVADSVAKDRMWLVSRLQMHWATHATQVFIRGEEQAGVGGDRAPVPTVKFDGTRGTAALFNRPALKDVRPFDDDSLGRVHFISRATGKTELAEPAKTGRNISNVNLQILRLALQAAERYASSGDERYGRMAADVVQTYLAGIFWRNVPQDLNHGHQQTLVGMQTFEVIHEDCGIVAAQALRILREPMQQWGFDVETCDAALKKWARTIVQNGVPHNNWNLFQAEAIVQMAMALLPDDAYSDHQGREHFLGLALHGQGTRQWGLRQLADFGFGKENIWCESPGYASEVVKHFTAMADRLDRDCGINLFDTIPQLIPAVRTLPQYLMPNRMICGFGDTHPGWLNREAFRNVRNYALRHGLDSLAAEMQWLCDATDPQAPDSLAQRAVARCFQADNVSWLIQRTGMNPERDLAFSLNASLGNHQHANGINLELYGRGLVLGPDAGIGKTLYSGQDYAEYYSQMPAHNTVVVDGVSSYPAMMSQHAFTVLHNDTDYAQVHFIEPETQSDQQRTLAMVKTATGGYYVDIFRSKRQDGNDRFHDYFYHNLGQTMGLKDAEGQPLALKETNELAFAGGHLYAYSYIYDQHKTSGQQQVRADFQITGGPAMRLWMQGSENRDIYQALSPPNLEYERMPNQPYDIKNQPVLTFVARQKGEAWTHPFVCIFEPLPAAHGDPTDAQSEILRVDYFQPKSADPTALGIQLTLRSGEVHYILSSASQSKKSWKGMTTRAPFAVFKRQGK